MSKRQTRTPDLNLLSAYLDHALRDTEKYKLEARLSQDPELQEILENLRRTKAMLGFLPRVKAPRNFTLTPEMIDVRKSRQPFFSTMRYATAIAAVLLVVLFSVEGITNLTNASMTESYVAMEESMVFDEEMEESMVFDEEAAPEPLILWGAPEASAGGIGGVGGGGNTDSILTEELTAEIDPEAEEEEAAISEEAEPAEEMPLIATTPQETEESAKVERGTDDEDTDSLILGLNPDEGGQIIEESIPDEISAKRRVVNITTLRWIEIGLAVLVFAGGVTLLITRKKAR